VLVIPTAGNHM